MLYSIFFQKTGLESPVLLTQVRPRYTETRSNDTNKSIKKNTHGPKNTGTIDKRSNAAHKTDYEHQCSRVDTEVASSVVVFQRKIVLKFPKIWVTSNPDSNEEKHETKQLKQIET